MKRGRAVRPGEDRHNVADQPGGAIFWTGVILAAVLGLSIRGLLNPTKVRTQVESAASRLHPDVRVSFDGAHVSLSQGLIPRFAVIIERVRMESPNACLFGPRLLADEIRLPISVYSWLFEGSPWKRLEAGEVELRLTKDRPSNCEQAETQVVSETPLPGSPSVGVTMVRRERSTNEKTSEEIDGVDIGRLNVISETKTPFSVDLERVEFRIRSSRPRVFHLRALTRLVREETTGEYLTSAQVEAEYKEFPEKILDLRLSGNWREGAYLLNGRYSPDDQQIRLDGELRHLPLSQFLIALKKIGGPSGQVFNPRQSWLSFKAEATGSVNDLNVLNATVRDFLLEGDLGEIAAEKIQIQKLQPLSLAPSRLEVRNLDFDRLLQFLGREHPSPILNRLGHFAGWVDIRDDQNFHLRGEHSGLEFIFSNKGEREIQRVDGLEGDLVREKGRWLADVKRAKFDQGEFEGKISLTADSEFSAIDLRLDADRLLLAPAVRRLMTSGGDVAPLQSQVKMVVKSGKLEQIKGSLKIPHLAIEGVTIEKFNAQFGDQKNEIVLSSKMDHLAMGADSAAAKVFTQIVPAQREFSFSQLSGRFLFRELNEIRWSGVTARLNTAKPSTLSSEGSWVRSGSLSGRVDLNGSQERGSWKVLGSRDEPVLEKVK